MMSRKLPSWGDGQPLRLVPGGSLKGGGEARTSSTKTSSNSRSVLSGGQDREVDGRLGFLSTKGRKGLEIQIPGCWRRRFKTSTPWSEGFQDLRRSGLLGPLETKD